MSTVHPHQLVSHLSSRWQDVESRFHEAYWESQVRASPESEQARTDLELELRELKGDPELLRAVEEALATELHEANLRRELEVMRLSLLGNQMSPGQRSGIVELSTAVEGDFASFRPEIQGRLVTDNDILEILASSSDEGLRRRAWEASKEIGERVSDRVRELARTRNEVAIDLGFSDYYRMSLRLQELDESWLFETLDQLERLTSEPFQKWKQQLDALLLERFGTERVYPWHYADPFFQDLPAAGGLSLDESLGQADAAALCLKTFGAWDIDLGPVLEGSDLYPRADKCQHAFCIDIDRTGDVRILANVVPGERWVETMLHESGHAAYDISIDRKLPYLLRRPTHTFVTEAIAILCGRLVRDGRWLTKMAGLDEREVEQQLSDLSQAAAAERILFARWGLVMTHFERDLYSDPEADLDARWWELVERFQLVQPPPDRRGPDWAAKVHVAVAPVYYHNYLLGELLASQIEAVCERDAGGLPGSGRAGDLLRRKIFEFGASLRWDELIKEATGRPLTADDFAASLAS
ncbi:MAG: M2 family metallopeptidase [Actinomycetota bacterium]|nr:M2 family metallopeptidase [Actinomycetota bacterium]